MRVMPFIWLSIGLLVSCGDNLETVNHITSVVDVQEFEGSYYFDNGGFIEIVQSDDDEVTLLRAGYQLASINPENGTIGSHPVVVAENLELFGDRLRFSRNVNYGSSTSYDLEQDISGVDITGTKRTDYDFVLTDAGITVIIEIYNAPLNQDINNVIARREMNGNRYR